jgi:hypothetical protein
VQARGAKPLRWLPWLHGDRAHQPFAAVPARAAALLRLTRFAHATPAGWLPFAVVLVFYLGVQVRYAGWDFARWDTLVLSGWALAVVGAVAAQGIPRRLHDTLRRLVDRKVLNLSGRSFDDVIGELEARADRWAAGTALVLAAVMAAAFLAAFQGRTGERIVVTTLAVLGTFLAGLHLGRMLLYGQLGWRLRARGFDLVVVPGHVDGAGGLKPVGDFYFVQAMIVAIPAIHLAAWTLLLPLYGERYAYWRQPYAALLAVAITLELAAFVVPMWAFHREMLDQKKRLLRDADHLSTSITQLQAQLAAGKSDDGAPARQLEAATQLYRTIEDLPVWPLDLTTRRRFRLNNLALLLPLLGRAFGASDLWTHLSGILRDFSA